MRYAIAGLLVIGALTGTRLAWGQEVQPGRVLQAMHEAYQQLDYAAAEQHAQEALAAYEAFTPAQLAEVHTTLALIRYAQSDLVEARQQFIAALSLEPDLTLDPLLVSPKILTFFEEIRAEQEGRPEPAGTSEPGTVRYVTVTDPRPAAALRSMIMPGWGQLYQGETTKGWVLLGLWSATAPAALVAQWQRSQAEEAYLAARPTSEEPDRVQTRYEAFNRWHRVRNNLLLAAGGIWLVGYVDALIGVRRIGPAEMRLTPGITPTEARVTLQLRF